MELYIPPSVFLDTNVLLDDILSRNGSEAAKQILQLGVERRLRICMSAMTTVNIAYIARKSVPEEKLREIFKLYLDYYIILPDTDMDVYDWVHGSHPDFEDSMQISCANRGRCHAIITNNTKHFAPYTDIPVYTPEAFLAKITQNPQLND